MERGLMLFVCFLLFWVLSVADNGCFGGDGVDCLVDCESFFLFEDDL